MNRFETSTIHTYSELLELIKSSQIKYNLEEIEKAFKYAEGIHKGQKRLSGEDYIEHVLTVAGYIVRLNLDSTSVVCALLHDAIEKGNVTLEAIDKEFGTEVAFIVDGLSSIRNFSKKFSETEKDIENFKILIFNAAEDIRIIIIRLAEKLHNLSTFKNLPDNIKQESARKALKIYGPLAEYLGLGYFQRVIEDMAFKILNPKEYAFITDQVEKYFRESEDVLNKFEKDLKEIMGKYNIKLNNIYSRRKSNYSIYKKLKRKFLKEEEEIKEESFEKLRDIYAFRIVVDTVEDCYLTLGLVHSQWEYSPEDFDDYISNPKENGYRSIHTVVNYKNIFIEVQFRTSEMEEYNEFGPACHIAYKLQGSQKSAGSIFTWTKDLLNWRNKETLSKEDFKIRAFSESIFVFTPKGLVVRLNKDASPVDFAFRVHTHIGYHYNGALVNNKMVSMDHKLKTGDVIDILVNKNVTANAGWLKYARSNSTKSYIRKLLNRNTAS